MSIDEKWIKNHPTFDQKWVKHRSKIAKIEVWKALGQVWRSLGPSWAIQSVFGDILDRLGGVLEASWSGLGGFLGGLGPRNVANMAPTWPPKRSQNQSKIDPKIDQSSSASWNRFLEGFWSILDASMEPSWDQNRSTIAKNVKNKKVL